MEAADSAITVETANRLFLNASKPFFQSVQQDTTKRLLQEEIHVALLVFAWYASFPSLQCASPFNVLSVVSTSFRKYFTYFSWVKVLAKSSVHLPCSKGENTQEKIGEGEGVSHLTYSSERKAKRKRGTKDLDHDNQSARLSGKSLCMLQLFHGTVTLSTYHFNR